MKSLLIFQFLLLLTLVKASEGQPTSHSSTAIVLIVVLLFILSLIACILYDKNNNFRWINSLRHCIGDLISKMKRRQKTNEQKQFKVETQQIMPTPKTNYVIEVDHERTYVDAEPKAVLHEALCPPILVQEQAKNVDLKNVFQARQTKHQKTKKSKSKLKNRLQSQVIQSSQQKPQGQQENSFTDDSQPETTNPQPSAPQIQE